MRNWKLFTIVFFSCVLKTWACGFSPYGEDIRFSLFLPTYVNVPGYESFCYHSNLTSFEDSKNIYPENVLDWYGFTGEKVAIQHIASFLQESDYHDLNEKSTNQFVQFLYKNKQFNVLNYLRNAKMAEPFNSVLFDDDPWELQHQEIKSKRSLFIKKLEAELQKEKDAVLQKKYAFLIIRLAYYDGDLHKIENLFETYFKTAKKDYLYYWSLYFYCFTSKCTFVDIANVFENSVSKRYASYYYFKEQFNFNEALNQAKNNTEKATIYAYASIQKVDRNLENLKAIYKLNPVSKSLEALLLREINKLEDWIYTPYYTNYLPSTQYNLWGENVQKETMNTLFARSEKDRLYAKDVLSFVKSANANKVNDPLLWKAAEIQLLFMTKSYNECLNKIAVFQKKHPNEKVVEELMQIKALCLVAAQKKGNTVVTKEIENIVLNQLFNVKFLFALGRELEYKDNFTDGLALISYADKIADENNMYYDKPFWRGNRLKTSGNLDYFYSYFDYLDFVFDTNQMQQVLNNVNTKPTTPYYDKIYSVLKTDYMKLNDLLGTKFLRENNLQQAYNIFKAMGDDYWEENYNAWERSSFDEGYYMFDQNPFYDFKYTPNFIPHKEKFIVSKLSVVDHLIKFEKLANDNQNTDCDYYYFIIATCYYNMADEGNSWMMRRFSSTRSFGWGEDYEKQSYIDEVEYRNRLLAQKYYKKAYQNARNDKFKALCLRMEELAFDGYPSKFQKLKKEFPEYYNDLSSCYSLNEYFVVQKK
ncbi:hypothetical protein MG290_10960 [Flavobacterium sp. CBA20B-1]|uniref:hypothetical protein n=1 Tax=unclassified Flavobacterium TaxID=196869 RepID=UPI002225484B|nr:MULTISPECIES: hypothetical protein [unclassified Flavobacterium]WCM41466.1 hypothetical protein MG290_10960 [Flavobacterium sp. CBA20B-1]